MEFEDILVKVGDYGKYQKRLILLFLIPSATLLPWFSLNNFFMISIPDHWCRVPELEPFNLTLEQEKQLIRPQHDKSCSTYDVNYTSLLLSSSENWTIPTNSSTRPCSDGWIYDKTNYEFTAASQFNMVCADSHLTSFLLTMVNVGSIFGTPIYGSLSDKIGRRITFFVVTAVTVVTAIASVLVSDFTAFIVLRAINGSLMPSIFQLPFIILLEIVGPDMRTRMNGIANSSWTLGTLILPLIAWLSRDWIKFGLITSAVIPLFFLYWPILPESPRWLLSIHKCEEATDVMTQIAKANGKNIERADIYSCLHKLEERIEKENQTQTESSDKPTSYWTSVNLRKKFIIVTYCWVADFTAYYGLQLNGYNLDGNEFLNFFLLGLAEVPGFIGGWFFMEKWGRRWCSTSGLALTGVTCLISAIYRQGISAIVLSFIAKFSASMSFMTVYQQASELYPTSLRGFGLGLSATVAGIITIAVPYMVFLNKYGESIPFLIISLATSTAAIAASFLPETLNENLPQTVNDAELFGKNQRYFSCNRLRRPSCHVEMFQTVRNGSCRESNADGNKEENMDHQKERY